MKGFSLFYGSLLLLGLLTASVSQASGLQEAVIINYGLYSAQSATEMTQDESQTTLTLLSDLKLRKKTTRIPAEVGNRFGLEVELKGSPSGEKVPLEVLVKHPKLRNPKSNSSSSSISWNLYPRLGDVIYAGWEFIADYECIPGQWSIQLQQGSRLLAKQNFTVYLPDEPQAPIQSKRPPPDPARIYLVQTGAFSDPVYAHQHMENLKAQGYKPCILPQLRDSKTLYFIYIAADTKREAAEHTAQNFQDKTGLEVYLKTINSSAFQEERICPYEE